MKILNKNTLTLQDYYLNNKPYPHIVLRDIFDNELLDDVVDNIKRINKEEDGKMWYKFCTKGNDFSSFGKNAVALTDYLISVDAQMPFNKIKNSAVPWPNEISIND